MTKRYTPEERAQALQLILEEYQSPALVGLNMGIPIGTLTGWASAERARRRANAADTRKRLEEAERAERVASMDLRDRMLQYEDAMDKIGQILDGLK